MSEVSNWKTKDLENTAIDDLPLSAPQGNYWQKMMGAIARKFSAVDAKLEKVEGAYVYRGTKATEDALPASENSVGDVWNVTENGHNYAWNGTAWDDLGGGVAVGGGLGFNAAGEMHVDFSTISQDVRNELLSGLRLPIFLDGADEVGFYVDGTNGSDSTGDGSSARPWATIGYAAKYIVENYNINSRTVSILVAGGTYTDPIELGPYQASTGYIRIKPATGDDVVTISRSGASLEGIVHTGGEWRIENISISITAEQQPDDNKIHSVYGIHTRGAGPLWVVGCDLSFTDNTLAASSGVRRTTLLYFLAASQGGTFRMDNYGPTQSVNWSGSRVNASVAWIRLSGGAMNVELNARQNTFNVSGSFSTFISISNGTYLPIGTSYPDVWNVVDSPTGKRYNIADGGKVVTRAADASIYFPGTTDGTVQSSSYSFIS